MALKKDLKQLIKPYYLLNIILSISYCVLKHLPVACTYIFKTDECEFNGRETEILFFLIIVVMIRSRKSGSVTMINYLSASFVYTKMANLVLWFNADMIYGAVYAVLFLLVAIFYPEPTYDGPDNVIYFRSSKLLQDELERDPTVTWIVAFYTVWNPLCVNLAPVFAELSVKYDLENLRFGKIDIGRYPDAGKDFKVSDSALSKQLPTIILFKEGKEIIRRPTFDAAGKLIKFLFSPENLVGAFDLNNLHQSCKKALSNPVATKKIKGQKNKKE